MVLSFVGTIGPPDRARAYANPASRRIRVVCDAGAAIAYPWNGHTKSSRGAGGCGERHNTWCDPDCAEYFKFGDSNRPCHYEGCGRAERGSTASPSPLPGETALGDLKRARLCCRRGGARRFLALFQA